jgi:DNA anti-recombination protein RmuC
MLPLSPDGESQRLSSTMYTLHDDVHERLKALELQLTLEYQRQRNQVEEELDKLRQQLVTITREQQQQHQTILTTLREAIEELRKEVAEALHRLSQDVDRVAQHAEAQTSRAVERLRHELLEMLLERDHTTVTRYMLGELLMTLGKQVQDAGKGEAS